jgi:hypothetical protein
MIRNALFPLTLLAFEAVGVRYWNTIFSLPVRWLCLGILLLLVLIRGEIRGLFVWKASILLWAYVLWCAFTIAWSELPELSTLKVAALIMLVIAFVGAGQAWSYRNPTLGYMLPIVVLTLFAGFFDRGAGEQAGSIEIYSGLAGNSNYLGAIAAMSFPYGLWRAYSSGRKGKGFLVWSGVTAMLVGVLWLAGSRAAMLCTLAIVLGFVAALKPGKRIMIVGVAGVLGLGAVIAVPAVKSSLYERFIVKGNTEDTGGALASRQEVWAESYEQALKGGVLGGGYGVTIGGGDYSFSELGLSAVGYGREKGNTQLAVWEETGLVGLGLYALLVVAVILELGGGFSRLRDQEAKVKLGLLLGAIMGFLVQSCFEAWWVAPGSAESAYFWATLGAAYGTLRRARAPQQASRPYGRLRTRRGASLYPASP